MSGLVAVDSDQDSVQLPDVTNESVIENQKQISRITRSKTHYVSSDKPGILIHKLDFFLALRNITCNAVCFVRDDLSNVLV